MLTIEQIEEKIARRPQSPLFAFLAGQYLEREEPERARELCLSGIDLYPTYSTAYYLLAKIFARESDFTSAYESIQRAISLNPTATAFLRFQTEIELQLSPKIEVPSETVQSPLSVLTEEADPVQLVQEEEVETPDEETGLEEISEILIEEIPGIDEPIATEILEEQVTIEEKPETNVEVSPDLVPSPIEDFQEESTVSPIGEEVETLDIETSDEYGTPTGSVLSDDVATGDLLIDQNTVLTEDRIPTEPSELPVEKLAVSSTSQIDINTEIALEPVEPGAIATGEIAAESTASTENIKQEDIQDEESLTTQRIDDGRIVSKTLAEIFASQGAYQEAIITYRLLKQMRPNLAGEIDARIGELENLQRERTGQL
jgi:tetratricopeptide (TPR) repeat protein